ncbi:hypothetical protein SLS55_006011 [Diplodia seriata]|uniref:Uncharacterized protein n=1 Tax=Diplodia seriata TaxID=420778 RepID=A0ABR3CCZ1_9PEZI
MPVAPPLPQNPSEAFHSLVRRFFTQSAHQPSNNEEAAIFFLFDVYNELVHDPKTYDKTSMTPEEWVKLSKALYRAKSSELAVFVKIADQIFSLGYDISTRSLIINCPSETQQRFSYYLTLTIDEQLHMSQHRQPAHVDRIGEYDPNDNFPQRQTAIGVAPYWTAQGDRMYTVRTPSIIMHDYDTNPRRPFYPLIIEVNDASKQIDDAAFARDYLLGHDDRPSLFLSITLWLEDEARERVGTFSLWRSRVLPNQAPPVGGYWPFGTEYEPECLVQNRRFTAPGGNADAGDGAIFLSFEQLSARCQDSARAEPAGTRERDFLDDGITISFERLSHIWQLARDRENYVESREFLMWEEERWEDIHGALDLYADLW